MNRLISQAEEVLSEEQVGFRKGRSTTEQIFNCRNLIEKHLESQKDLYHNFIDFKNAFDSVWHEGLWSTLNKYGIDSNIALMIKSLYTNSTRAMLFNSIQGQMYKTTVGVRQRCILYPVLFDLFLEEIMAGIQDEHISTISICGRNLSNIRFADDIDLIAGSNDELQTLKQAINSASRYGMQINAEKSKIMINSNNRNLHTKIQLYGEKLEEVDKFKYIGATITKYGSSDSEIKIRLAQATSAMVMLTTIWNSKDIRFKLKYNLYRSLVLSILTYGCEYWTISAISTKNTRF